MKIQSTNIPEIEQKLRAPPPAPVLKPVSGDMQPQPQEEIDTLTGAENEALKKSLALSFLVYDPEQYVRETLTAQGYTHVEFFSKFYTGAQGVCAVKNGVAYIVFRGSVSILDWLMDFAFLPFYWPLRHFGFETTWRSLRKNIRSWLTQAEFDSVVIAGHSLGGAMAHLAAFNLAADYNITNVFTFGAPKGAFLGTAKRINETAIQGDPARKLGDVIYCTVNQRDIVAKMPLRLLGFRDIGHLIYINHTDQVFINKQAQDRRSHDSIADVSFVSDMLGAEKDENYLTAESGLFDYIKYGTNQLIWGMKKTMPGTEIIPITISLYFLIGFYFTKSTLNHMTEQYLGVFFENKADIDFERKKPGKIARILGVIKKTVIVVILGGLFLWGLWEISVFLFDFYVKYEEHKKTLQT
ncbi:MAG: lipase family protein [Alphaproteobacteria bacterium]